MQTVVAPFCSSGGKTGCLVTHHDAFPMVLRSGTAAEEVVRLIRARRLLAAAVDHYRAIVGEVSREWIVSEAERRMRWDRVPPALRPRFQQPGAQPPESVNSNWLPKLEPLLDACILTGVMLFGARLFGRGTPDPAEGVGCREIDTDLIIAGMIHETFGLRDTCTAYLRERHRLIDEGYLAEEFSEGVLMRVWDLRERLAVFDMACAKGAELPVFPPEYANAIAAVTAARLRLTAHPAVDELGVGVVPAVEVGVDRQHVSGPFVIVVPALQGRARLKPRVMTAT